MKKLAVFLVLSMLAISANAARYSPPPVKVTYVTDGVLYSTANFISTGTVLPYGQSKVVSVMILNNTAVAKNFDVSIKQLIGTASTQFSTDAGCDVLLAAYTSCVVNVTFTPAAASPDGTVQTDTESFSIITSAVDGTPIKTYLYTIAGYSQ